MSSLMCCARLYCTAAHFSIINSSPLGLSFFQLYFFCTDFFGSAGSAGVNAHFLFAGGSCVLGVVTSLVLVLGTSVIIVISGPTRESNDPEGIKENEPLTRTSSTMVATFASTLLHSFPLWLVAYFPDLLGFLISRTQCLQKFAWQWRPQSQRVPSDMFFQHLWFFCQLSCPQLPVWCLCISIIISFDTVKWKVWLINKYQSNKMSLKQYN